MALLPLLAAARQTLQLYVDPRFTLVRYIHAQKLGQKIGQIWFSFPRLSEPWWFVPPFSVSDSVNQTCKQARAAG